MSDGFGSTLARISTPALSPPLLDFDPRDYFHLDPAFLHAYDGKAPPWGPLGAITFARTYPRFLYETGRYETPAEVFARCVEATLGTLHHRATVSGAHWSPEKAQADGQEMFRRMWALKILPSGRGLANLGTPALQMKGAAVAYSCAFLSTATVADDFARPFCELMDYLMLGVGVGFDVRGAALSLPILRPQESAAPHTIEDTREGWIDAVRRLLWAFRGKGSLPGEWDVSLIRPKGAPLKTFGGISSGPGPLLDLLHTLVGLYASNIGGTLDVTLITDTMNVIGRCVVAGGIRRSSEVAIGPMTGEGSGAFAGLKDPASMLGLMSAVLAVEVSIPGVIDLDAWLKHLRERQALHSVMSDAFAALQDIIDTAEGERRALCLASPKWQRANEALNNHPLRAWRWASNNSVLATVGSDYTDVARRIGQNGEPGILWLDNIQRFGRMADGELTKLREIDDDFIPGLRADTSATGCNPCQPAEAEVLTPQGIRTFADIEVGSTIWSGSRWTRVVRKVATGVKPVYRYRTSAGQFIGTVDHRVLSSGVRVPVGDTEHIDLAVGPIPEGGFASDPQDVMDGLVLGDGSYHGASRRNFLYEGVNDDCYATSEVAHLLGTRREYGAKVTRGIITTITEPLPKTYARSIPERFLHGDTARVCGFLRGLYSANGSVVACRVMLKATSRAVIDGAQSMLSSVGIASYVTTNAAHEVTFSNGTYRCRESYDLNISTAKGRTLFAYMIGFIHPAKTAKLQALADAPVSKYANGAGPKVSYDVLSVEPLGEMDVFDITVDADEHTYWTSGLLVSNCGEIALEDGELCCLVETFPGRCESVADWLDCLKYAYMIGKALTDLPIHNARTHDTQQRNRRLGISISGIAEWYTRLGMPRMVEALDRGYREMRRLDRLYSGWLDMPESLRLTTVKPSGSVSLLAGVEGGMRFPEAPFWSRAIRLHDTSPIIRRLAHSGYRIEPDRYAPNTVVAFFPIRDTRVGRYVSEVSVWEQARLQVALQRHWSDNMVSATWMFKRTEASEIGAVLREFEGELKGMSALPLNDHSYVQPPYATITEREYAAMSARLKPLDLANLTVARDSEERYCDGGVCSLVPPAP